MLKYLEVMGTITQLDEPFESEDVVRAADDGASGSIDRTITRRKA